MNDRDRTESNQSGIVSDDALFDAIVTEATGFYNMLLAVASGFLGGSLVFIEKIAPSPPRWSLAILGIGWASLLFSLMVIIWVRRQNLESGKKALEKDYSSAKNIDQKKDKLTTWATILLALGVSSLLLFGMINLYHKTVHKKEKTMTRKKRSGKEGLDINRSIPFGSIGNESSSNQGQNQGQDQSGSSGESSENQSDSSESQADQSQSGESSD
jgi:hypothetical protein